MFDGRLQPWLRQAYDPLGRTFAWRGVAADTVTLAGFGVGLGAGAALAAGAFKTGLTAAKPSWSWSPCACGRPPLPHWRPSSPRSA